MKGQAAQEQLQDPGALLIAADTMVFLDGLRLGKPKNEADAFSMLSALSGRTHHVCTGVTVCQGSRSETRSENQTFHLSLSHCEQVFCMGEG